MSQDKLIKLVAKETKEVYYTRKNKKLVTRKIELKKFSKKLKKRIVFKEAKKQVLGVSFQLIVKIQTKYQPFWAFFVIFTRTGLQFQW